MSAYLIFFLLLNNFTYVYAAGDEPCTSMPESLSSQADIPAKSILIANTTETLFTLTCIYSVESRTKSLEFPLTPNEAQRIKLPLSSDQLVITETRPEPKIFMIGGKPFVGLDGEPLLITWKHRGSYLGKNIIKSGKALKIEANETGEVRLFQDGKPLAQKTSQ